MKDILYADFVWHVSPGPATIPFLQQAFRTAYWGRCLGNSGDGRTVLEIVGGYLANARLAFDRCSVAAESESAETTLTFLSPISHLISLTTGTFVSVLYIAVRTQRVNSRLYDASEAARQAAALPPPRRQSPTTRHSLRKGHRRMARELDGSAVTSAGNTSPSQTH